ncbi:MAG: ROK family protein [Elusimicrobia bacterium]|nr:ROK family protein [Elusimicrobiota bacterium]
MKKQSLRLGIDLGGTQVKTALVDARGKIVSMMRVDTARDPQQLVEALKSALRPWLGLPLIGTGIGVAGDVDPEKGLVRFAPNLKWKSVRLKDLFQKAGFPRPICFDNDATAAAWGAYHVELKRHARHLIVLTLGTGVGGGLVLNGQLYHGATGTAGELGHITIDTEGPACGCGNTGCLETYLGAAHLVKWAKRQMAVRGRKAPEDLTPRDLSLAAKKGDAVAKQAWQRAGDALGIGLSNLINIFNPDTILLCGGVAGASPLFLPRAKAVIARRAFQTARKAATVRVSEKSQHLGVIGAALLVP